MGKSSELMNDFIDRIKRYKIELNMWVNAGKPEGKRPLPPPELKW